MGAEEMKATVVDVVISTALSVAAPPQHHTSR